MTTTLLLTGLAAALVGLASFLYGRTTGEQRGREQARRDLDTIADAAADRTNQQAREAYERTAEQVVKRLRDANEVDRRSDRQLAEQKLASTTAPLRESLDKVENLARQLGERQSKDHVSLQEVAKRLSGQVETVLNSANSLRDALKGDRQARGRWGEVQLQRVVEMAGLIEHCDFATQTTSSSGGRPDLVVNLPGAARVAVDSKVPMDDYLAAIEVSNDPDGQEARLQTHAQRVKEHINALSKRAYADDFEGPSFTVLFLPLESLLSEAIRHQPELLQFAAKRQIVLATPYTLMGLLWSVRTMWQHEDGTRNAEEICKEGEELRRHLNTFFGHLADVGTQLRKTTASYNKAVNKSEGDLIRQLKKLRKLGGEPEDGERDKLPEPVVDVTPRLPLRDDMDIPPERELI